MKINNDSQTVQALDLDELANELAEVFGDAFEEATVRRAVEILAARVRINTGTHGTQRLAELREDLQCAVAFLTAAIGDQRTQAIAQVLAVPVPIALRVPARRRRRAR